MLWKNKLGFYNIVGNVEEWLDTGGAIGGGFTSKPSEVTTINQYDGGDARVGFRLVMEKID
ncbi:MAG: hypothetical protein AAGJ93_00105 [Bacteroidota bacterium]